MTPESNRVFTVGMEWRGRSRAKRQSPHGHKTLSRPAVKIVRQLLTLSGSCLPLSKRNYGSPLRLGLTAPPESDYSPSARFRDGTEEGPERSGPFPFRHPKGKLFRRAWLPTEPSPLPDQRYNSF